jgi:hypothetical protein
MAQGRFRSAPTKHFLRELKRLPAHAKERVLLTIEELVTNPFAGTKLSEELSKKPPQPSRGGMNCVSAFRLTNSANITLHGL